MSHEEQYSEYYSGSYSKVVDGTHIECKATYKTTWLSSFVIIYIKIKLREESKISDYNDSLISFKEAAKDMLKDWYKNLSIPDDINTKVKYTGVKLNETNPLV
jgi:hypothetical protein